MTARRLARHTAVSVASAIRRGSSWPVVVRTEGGEFLTKLRGAAQGVLPLIAEIIVGELATALDLPVPERAIITLEDETPSDDQNDELLDLLGRSRGENLGFRYLRGATDLRTDQLYLVAPEVAATTLWLDGLVMNPDRTARNPNIMLWNKQPWLIDHGAALSFHFDISELTEQTAREAPFDWATHLFASRAAGVRSIDEACARALSRDVLAEVVAAVPEAFLVAAFPAVSPPTLRGIYAAVLWKRLKDPRPFLPE